ncbi:hypothetical protein ACHHYP_05941 [Achlya hypogyna]|uniref:Protein kinase domain-containing protein n=1 Tax=Achlya hypogyna TaxID=1202772 RepID=A0A1V9YW21_ACHHY|nr:hypothetical protein ACHHYP_05941 [Achlya hypogyna]
MFDILTRKVDEFSAKSLLDAVRAGKLDKVSTWLNRGGDPNAVDEKGESILFIAASKGFDGIAQKIVTAGGNINFVDKFGATPLFVAATKGHTSIVAMILANNGVDINSQTVEGNTPIFMASWLGHVAIVELLIAANADLTKFDSLGATPLHIATEYGQETIVGMLLEAGASPNQPNRDGRTPVFMAAWHGHRNLVQRFISANADINKCDDTNRTPLFMAACHGHDEIVALLIQANADINKWNQDESTPTLISAEKGRKEAVELFIAAHADINKADKNGFTPIFMAVLNNHAAIVKVLIEADADIYKANNAGKTPLMVALERNHEAISQMLLDAGTQDRQSLLQAVTDGNFERVSKLLAKGVDPNVSNEETGESLLFLAVSKGFEGMVGQLVAAGADVDKPDLHGRTAIHVAASKGYSNLAQMLLRGDYNKQDEVTYGDGALVVTVAQTGRSPIFMAALNGHKTIVELLVLVHADLNSADNEGNTPIHAAVASGHRNIVEMLVTAEANFSLANALGRKPIDIATDKQHYAIASLLSDAEATDRVRLLKAAGDGDMAQVWLLLGKATDPNVTNDDGDSVLYIATTKGHQGVVQKLIAAGADVNRATNTGRTPLLAAAEIGHRPIVVMLIRARANISYSDNVGTTPLLAASTNGHDAVVGMLITCGADVDTNPADGHSPLYVATSRGHTAVVNLLLAMGADPNVQDEEECTPLFVAASKGFASIVDLLVQAGADFVLCNRVGITPLFVARKRGHRDVVKILHDADTKVLQTVRDEDVTVTSTVLGRGGQGVVYKGRWNKQEVAVKTVLNTDGLDALEKEIATMSRVNSPYIIKMITVLDKKTDEPKMVLEYMNSGDLRSYLDKKRSRLPTDVEFSKLELAWAIANGVYDLHAQNILHRDLKASNVLLSTTNYIKIADFGISRDVDTNTLTMGIGTSYWIAPEVFDGDGHYAFAADIYSLGVILTELDTLQTPYANLNLKFMTILDNVRSGKLRPELSPECDEWYADLANWCLEFKPEDRPTAAQVLGVLERQMRAIYPETV